MGDDLVIGAINSITGVNAFAGVFLVVIVDPIPVIAAPAGLVGALVVAVVAALFWVSTRKWAGRVR